MVVIGVDPGRYGGIATLDDEYMAQYVIPMPAKSGHEYDIGFIRDHIADFAPEDVMLVIEQVTRPASLTRCQGIFEGLGWALGYDVRTVRPQTWKAHFGLHSDKRASMGRAAALYPHLANEFRRVTVDDGKAEAILIATYGRDVLL